ncbi:pupal cuticle protein Edg-78E-like [Stomoxys calcitrans]|uniref:Pupal cuticle protein Edg-78E n=1 Tax=Stomoxys calcitrans TaxID=35570 RepID=A0A1I8PJN1_STOCA|nr:pupal cuticle protein Edg-78E-like [Stomoxys calcitrans]
MNKFVLIAIVATLACGVLAGNPQDVHAYTVKFDSDIDPTGNYKYNYETSNGIGAQERGLGGEYATGGYGYYSPEGKLIQVSYVADQDGFKPTGNHLPTPPPIPYAILKSLEYIRTHPQVNNKRRFQ